MTQRPPSQHLAVRTATPSDRCGARLTLTALTVLTVSSLSLKRFLVGACWWLSTAAMAWPGMVTHVTDGDTVWVQPLQGGEVQKIRLLGLDAPEVCQAWGPQSRDALHGVLQGQLVDVQGRYRDTYGRLLANISRQGHDVGAWMVSQGHAWSSGYQRRAGPYDALQMQAQSQHLGLFADGRAVLPRVFRKRFGSCH